MNRTMNKQEHKEALKTLKGERKIYIEQARTRVKKQNQLIKKIKTAMAGGASTIPEIASSIKTPTHDVFWHVTALKNYGQVEEGVKAGGYFTYRLTVDKEEGERASSPE